MEKATSSNNASGNGIGFAGMLAILFIALKLTHVIDWSWLWVLAPLWVGVAFVLVLALILAVLAALADRR